MLTILIKSTREGWRENVFQATEFMFEGLYATNMNDYNVSIQNISDYSCTLLSPDEDCMSKPFPYRHIMLKDGDGDWRHIFTVDSDIFVMNEYGKTIATYRW